MHMKKLLSALLIVCLTVTAFSQVKYSGFVQQLYQPERNVVGNAVRYWFNSQTFTPPGSRFGGVTLSPNRKGFPHPVDGLERGDLDTFLKRQKERGINIIACMSGSFDEQYNTPLKSLPKDNPSDSKLDISSYDIYTKILVQTVIRYGSVVVPDSLIDIEPYGQGPWAPQIKKSGLDYLEWIQLGNEWNKYPGKPSNAESLEGDEYAPLFDWWCEKVWAIDPSMKILSMATAKFDQQWLDKFKSKSVHAHDSRVTIAMNVYLFGGCSFGQTCDAIKPFESTLPDQVNNWLVANNFKGFITEFGCGTEKHYDLSYPNYPGLDKNYSQAEYLKEGRERWLALSNIYGLLCYQNTDDPNESRFRYTGICYYNSNDKPNPIPKPHFQYLKEIFEQDITPEPPPTVDSLRFWITTELDLNNNPPAVQLFSGTNIKPGDYVVYVTNAQPRVRIRLDQFPESDEGVKPFVLGGDNNGVAKTKFSITAGSHVISANDDGGQNVSVSFTAGDVIQPISINGAFLLNDTMWIMTDSDTFKTTTVIVK